ncbi:Imm8 family immunity protein, partial [Cellulomonas composti]|uniref:Imm8 family immunity protein n=1 Tax=Cellulomonas composti TaxID=266130 RepID=UPI001649E6EA
MSGLRAEIVSFWSPDVDDLASWVPPAAEFQFYLQFTLREPGVLGEDTFGVTVRSSAQLLAGLSANSPMIGDRSIIVADYDWSAIRDCVRSSIELLASRTDSWTGLIFDASLLFDWEGSGQLRQWFVGHSPG